MVDFCERRRIRAFFALAKKRARIYLLIPKESGGEKAIRRVSGQIWTGENGRYRSKKLLGRNRLGSGSLCSDHSDRLACRKCGFSDSHRCKLIGNR